MKKLKCTRCDKLFEKDFGITWESPICDECNAKGLKPYDYHRNWGCTCEWCLENKKPCKHCGCNVQESSDKPDTCVHCLQNSYEHNWQWVRIGPWAKNRCSVKYWHVGDLKFVCRECFGGDCDRCLEELCSCNHKDMPRIAQSQLIDSLIKKLGQAEYDNIYEHADSLVNEVGYDRTQALDAMCSNFPAVKRRILCSILVFAENDDHE